jgi:hypothetical protein
MITACPVPASTQHRPGRLRRAFPQHRARLSRGARADPQTVHLCRGRLGRRRLSLEQPRRRRGLLLRPWLDGICERYGMDPEIRYFHTAAITDNTAEAVLLPEAAD